MRCLIGVLAIMGALTTGVLGSAPGQPISCDDFVFTTLSLVGEPFLPPILPETCSPSTPENLLQCGFSVPTSRQDAQGNVYAIIQGVDWWEIWRTRSDGVLELVASIPTHRPATDGRYDTAFLLADYLDPVRGALYTRLASGVGGPGPWPYPDIVQVCRITGLVPLAEVIRQDLGLPPGLGKGTR